MPPMFNGFKAVSRSCFVLCTCHKARRENRSAAGLAKFSRYTSIWIVSPAARKSINSPPIQEPQRVSVPGRQYALLPLERAFLVDEAEQDVRSCNRTCRRHKTLLGHKRN